MASVGTQCSYMDVTYVCHIIYIQMADITEVFISANNAVKVTEDNSPPLECRSISTKQTYSNIGTYHY